LRRGSPRAELIGALAKVAQALRGGIVLFALGLNTLVLTGVLFLCSIAKLLALTDTARYRVRRFLARLPVAWIAINNGIFTLMRITQWDIEVPPGLDRDGCYLVLSNHQSWADVLILQRGFNRRLPFLRFFVKKALIWLPFLGAAWWALDMPFMQRYSKEQLEHHPELKGRDLENARQACEKFRQMPVAMMTFPEGTRFSTAKRVQQNSSYRMLLEPHIGGIGQVLYALGDELDALIDVTIVFPGRGGAVAPTLWQVLSGQVDRIVVRARQLPIPLTLRGRNFRTDPDFRLELEQWVAQLWRDKDELIVRSAG
jgi:1-acyl-sn-glycerol-3-phosphate acyltransferase